MDLKQVNRDLITEAAAAQVSPSLIPALGTYTDAPSALLVHVSSLPERWDLNTADGVRAALSQLMPGQLSPSHPAMLANKIAQAQQSLEHLPQVPTLASELAILLDLVDFGRVSR
jgi:hypothetical protein